MSDVCQRWRDGRHSWRRRAEGGFDRSRYDVGRLERSPAKAFVTRHHYSGSYPAPLANYGLWDRGDLVGVAVLSVPVNVAALTSAFPGLVPLEESIELGRFVLLDEVPANGESFFLSQVFRLAGAKNLRGVLSCSDPQPRRAAGGALIVPGHVGTIYQATNARYLGRATARTLYVLPGGTVLNARAMQKVRAQERGHGHVERLLLGLGAGALRAGDDPAAWLNASLARIGATRIRHRGNHRYAFALGTPAQRRHVEMAMAHGPYPKSPDQEAA